MFTTKNIIIALLAIVLIGSAGTAYYFYDQYQKSQEALNNPEQVAKEETQRLIDRMSTLIALPEADIENGEPTLATVQDKEKLKDQEFFANAENGDKVLIYAKAKKAFLFRPETNKVINVAPVSIGEGDGTQSATNSATPTDEDDE
jgi:hypothetical protein